MTIYCDTDDGCQVLAVEIHHEGRPVGWVEPADWHAYLDGQIDAAGLCRIAGLQPEPPAGAVTPAPARFVVEQVEP